MGLDFRLYETVFDMHTTHNLTEMADEAGIYKCLWRPHENGYWYAGDLIIPLMAGLIELRAKPDYYKKFDSENGWGTYEQFVPYVEEVLKACISHPKAEIDANV